MASLVGYHYYSMTHMGVIDQATLSLSPETLSEKRIIFFDKENNPNLKKYKDYLEKVGVTKIKDVDKQVLAIARLIDYFHNEYALKHHRLSSVPEYFIIKDNGAYCQQSALLLSKCLSSIGIYSMQWHLWDDKTKTSPHQFLSYYNPSLKKWIIIDIYLGAQYAYNERLLSVPELTYLNQFKQIPINSMAKPFIKDSFGQLTEAWDYKVLHVSRASDVENLEDPVVKFGVFGYFPWINTSPVYVKKVFRFFGRAHPDILFVMST